MKRIQYFSPIHFYFSPILNCTDFKRVHSRDGFRHVERLPHNQQQGALCLLLGSPAAVSTQSRAHGKCSHLHGNKPTGRNERPQGIFHGWTAASCKASKIKKSYYTCPSSLLINTGRPAGTEGTDCSLTGQAAGRPQRSADPTGETV